MLGFVVPFKAKNNSKNWKHDCDLLKQTLYSICNQTSPWFKVFVVYTDMPETPYENAQVNYIRFPYTFCTNQELIAEPGNSRLAGEKVIDERMHDQGKRVMHGCIHAKKNNCSYVMLVDADDLVSNRIVGYVKQNNRESLGWFINKGYILKGAGRLLIAVNKNMNHLNGSTNIVNIKLIPEVNFESKLFSEFAFFSAHAYLKDRLFDQYRNTLKPLPFYGVIYRLHDHNWTGYKSTLEKHFVRTFFKYILRGKILTSVIKKEFGVNLTND